MDVPSASRFVGFARWEMTVPAGRLERTRLTAPSEHRAVVIVVRATLS
jgi:hypothetical protein